jgi:hypothetical protein
VSGPRCGSSSNQGGAETSVAVRTDLAGLAELSRSTSGIALALRCAVLGVVVLVLRRVWRGSTVVVALRRGAVGLLAGRRRGVVGLRSVGGVVLLGRALVAAVGRSAVALVLGRRGGVLLLLREALLAVALLAVRRLLLAVALLLLVRITLLLTVALLLLAVIGVLRLLLVVPAASAAVVILR